MPRERDHFATAHSTLSEYAAAGRFGWGHPLAATTLAVELGLSPTPVREALAHLAGEGVIEHRPGRGYFAPSPSSSDIIELYQFHRLLIHAALSEAADATSQTDGETSTSDAVEAAFETLAGLSRNSVIVHAQSRVAKFLRPIRRVEALVAPLSPDLRERLVDGVSHSGPQELSVAVDDYHRDRCERAQDVFIVMRRSAKSIDQI